MVKYWASLDLQRLMADHRCFLSERCESRDQRLLGSMRCLWVREIGEQESIGDFKSMQTGEQKVRMKNYEPMDKTKVSSTFSSLKKDETMQSEVQKRSRIRSDGNVERRLRRHFRTCDDQKERKVHLMKLDDGRPIPRSSVHRGCTKVNGRSFPLEHEEVDHNKSHRFNFVICIERVSCNFN